MRLGRLGKASMHLMLLSLLIPIFHSFVNKVASISSSFYPSASISPMASNCFPSIMISQKSNGVHFLATVRPDERVHGIIQGSENWVANGMTFV
jgi:hypothetical protein